MQWINWAKAFEERKTYEDIPRRVRATELGYWLFLILSVIVTLIGVFVLLAAPEENIRLMLMGLFVAVDGLIACALIKIWAHIRLAMYWIIWDRQNRSHPERPQ